MSKTVELTLPKERVVRGYTIRKMNLGEQIQALAVLEELPNEVMKTCFPGQGPSAVLLGLQGFTADSIVSGINTHFDYGHLVTGIVNNLLIGNDSGCNCIP